jgi:hypothetical protein
VRPVSVAATPTAATLTTVYTVPTGYYALFNLMYLHNTTGSTKTITAQWYDASAATSYDILTGYSMGSKEYLKFDGGAYIVLEEGDQFRVTTESGSTFSVLGTFELYGAQRT